jgi:hypothetical protein
LSQQGPQFIDLNLAQMQIVQQITGHRCQMAPGLGQPILDRVWIQLKDPRCGPDIQALSQSLENLPDRFGGHLLAIEDGVDRFQKGPTTDPTL